MRRDYKALLLAILTFAFITSGLLLFGTIDATQVDAPACEQQFRRECSPRKGCTETGLDLSKSETTLPTKNSA